MCKVKKKRVLISAAIGSALCALVPPGAIWAATSPTTVYNSTTSVGYDSTNFSSLTVGLNSTTQPNSLINLDGSLITGYDLNANDGYREMYSVNLTSLSVSIVALNDADHQIVGNTGNAYNPSLDATSPSGIIVGSQGRNGYDSGGNTASTGNDVFTSNNGAAPVAIPVPVTVLGGNATYSFTSTQTGTSDHYLSTQGGSNNATGFSASPIGQGGIVVGSIERFAGDGYTTQPSAILGTDGFYYNPSTGLTTAIGLTGGQYNYNPSFVSDPTLVEHSTFVVGAAGSAGVGFTQLFDSSGNRAGYDGWMYTPSLGTVQIGLTGGQYTYNNGTEYEFTQIYRMNSAGQIAGKSNLVSGVGDPLFDPSVAWLYAPSATPGVASGFGTSAAGTYVRLGLTATPSGTTLGNTNLSGNGNTNVAFLENNGHATGTSNRYDSSGTSQGLAAWYYNGSTTTDISPTDAIHGAAAGGAVASSNTITAMNNTGMAAGFATRITGTISGSASRGEDAYVWDSNSSTLYFVDPADEAQGTGNYEFSYVSTLGDNGMAVGYYNTYSGSSSTVLSSTLFAWSKINGLQPLATYNGSSASSTMSTMVSSFQFGADGELYGVNTFGNVPTSIVAYGFNDTWNNSLGTGDGKNWDASSQNWSNSVIPLVYLDSASVTFNDTNNHDYAVTLNQTVKPNAVTFNNSAGNYTISGAGGIAGGGSLTKMGSSTVTLNTVNTYTGGTTVSNGSLVVGVNGALPNHSLAITGGKVQLAANTGLAQVTSLTISAGAALDITNNHMIINYTGSKTTEDALIRGYLINGYHGGAWNGTGGIDSSTAGLPANSQYGIGYADGADGVVAGLSSGQIEIKYTLLGDADLDGAVTGNDFTILAGNLGKSVSGWDQGDFNYDGVVSGSDFTALVGNLGKSASGADITLPAADYAAIDAFAQANGLMADVPEPASTALLATAAVGLLWRRGRKID